MKPICATLPRLQLLWECYDWLLDRWKKVCKAARIRMPRNKYGEQKTKYLAYKKNKKKSYKQKQRRIKSLLYLLNKLSGQIDVLAAVLPVHVKLPLHYYSRRAIIYKVFEQQTYQY